MSDGDDWDSIDLSDGLTDDAMAKLNAVLKRGELELQEMLKGFDEDFAKLSADLRQFDEEWKESIRLGKPHTF